MDENWVCLSCMHPAEGPVCDKCGSPAGKSVKVAGALPPETILGGRYLVGGVVGGGGFGITYRALDLKASSPQDRIVAIKEYFPRDAARRAEDMSLTPIADDKDFAAWRDNFRREYAVLTRLKNCPAVAGVRETFAENQTAYLVMDFVSGQTLEGKVRSQGRFDPNEMLDYFREFVLSLEFMHQSNILHRDINPANIILSEKFGPKLIDFGSARPNPRVLKRPLTVFVRRGYAPPEQYRSDGKQGTWTDVYGLCATLYFALTGVDPTDALDRRIGKELTPIEELQPQIPQRLAKAITKGLSLAPEDRPQDFAALARMMYPDEKPLAQPAAPVQKQPVNQPQYAPAQPAAPQYAPAAPQFTPAAQRSVNSAPAGFRPVEIRGDLFLRRLNGARRAAEFVGRFDDRKGTYLLNSLDSLVELPAGEERWKMFEKILWEGGKFFSILAIMKARK